MAFESRYALVAGRHQRPDRHLRAQRAPAARCAGSASRPRAARRSAARARARRSAPTAASSPSSRAPPTWCPATPTACMDVFVARSRRRRRRHLRRGRQGLDRARRHRDLLRAACVPAQALGGDSGDPAISGNGRYIAFQSAATNLLTRPATPTSASTSSCSTGCAGSTRLISRNFNNLPGRRPQPQSGDEPERPLRRRSSRSPTTSPAATPARRRSVSDIFLHDRDTDEDGVFDEPGRSTRSSSAPTRCGQPADATTASSRRSPTTGNFVVFATVAGNAKVDGNCVADRPERARATSSSGTASAIRRPCAA